VIFSELMKFTLDYDRMFPLDAESLAETGIKRAYDSLVVWSIYPH
jgi:hypothetical protein